MAYLHRKQRARWSRTLFSSIYLCHGNYCSFLCVSIFLGCWLSSLFQEWARSTAADTRAICVHGMKLANRSSSSRLITGVAKCWWSQPNQPFSVENMWCHYQEKTDPSAQSCHLQSHCRWGNLSWQVCVQKNSTFNLPDRNPDNGDGDIETIIDGHVENALADQAPMLFVFPCCFVPSINMLSHREDAAASSSDAPEMDTPGEERMISYIFYQSTHVLIFQQWEQMCSLWKVEGWPDHGWPNDHGRSLPRGFGKWISISEHSLS